MAIVSKSQRGASGVFKVVFEGVGEKMAAKDNFPAALRVKFSGDVVLAVPLDNWQEASRRMRAFLSRPLTEADYANPEAAIAALAVRDAEWWVSTYGGFIQRFLCPPGTHMGQVGDVFRQKGIPSFYESENRFGPKGSTDPEVKRVMRRTKFFLEAHKDGKPTGLMTEVDIPWAIRGEYGRKPGEDEIGYNEKAAAWGLLRILGFSWERFEAEVKDAPALYDREGVTSLIGDANNLVPFFFNRLMATPATVQWVVVETEEGQPILLKEGEYKMPHIIPVVVIEGSAKPDAFAAETARLTATLDSFTRLAGGQAFLIGNALTPEGKSIATGILVPLVRERYPRLSLKKREDGSAVVSVPFTPEVWSTDAVVALGLTFEAAVRHMSKPVEDLSQVSDLTSPVRFFEWLDNEPVKGALEAVGRMEEL